MQKLLKLLKLGPMILALFLSLAEATVYVEVTGGQVGGIPIAVAGFAGDAALGDQITEVLRKDLQGSGQFRTLVAPAGSHAGSLLGLGVEYGVTGRIESQGSGYLVQFELLDLLKHKSQGSAAAQTPILSMRFEKVSPKKFRALAHHISDLLFEKLIGVKGIFSTRVAYVNVLGRGANKEYVLEMADQDGYNPKVLYTSNLPLMSPAWSPDAQKIAFVTFDKNRSAVNVIDVRTGKIEKITQFPGINGAPAWSPDGKSLALVLSKDGGPRIYVADLEQKRLSQLTQGPGIDTEPRWFPDGRSLVFTSDRGGKPQIYKINVHTGHTERLTFSGSYNARPSVTPDGKNLVHMHKSEQGDKFSIAIQNLNTGTLKVLTHSGFDESPTVAPNGMMVLYGTQEGVLGAVSIDGRVRLRLPAQAGTVQEPAWAPFNQF